MPEDTVMLEYVDRAVKMSALIDRLLFHTRFQLQLRQ